MALFRCNKCGHLREVNNDYIGKSVKCPKCSHVAQIYETISFVEKLLEKYFVQRDELHKLRQAGTITEAEVIDAESPPPSALNDINLFNTTALAEEKQVAPIADWFKARKIKIEADLRQLDTTGFFDEVAVSLGTNYALLKDISEKIKRTQKKGYQNLSIPLSKRSQKETREIIEFCQNLYEYSFVAKYFYQKQEKLVRLALQTSPAIVQFFDGRWFEWYVFIKLTEFFRDKNQQISCARNVSVLFANEDFHELDIFFLVDGRLPICIECKTGEFRTDIEKYRRLRTRIKLDKAHFLLCVLGLSQEQAAGLSSMYDLTFVNEQSFLEYVEKLL